MMNQFNPQHNAFDAASIAYGYVGLSWASPDPRLGGENPKGADRGKRAICRGPT